MSEDKVRVAVITVSDRSAAGTRDDQSGPAVQKLLEAAGFEIVVSDLVPDESDQISAMLTRLADRDEVDLIFTTGGTGFAARDVTPEATLSVLEKRTPGIDEAIRMTSLEVTPHAMLSRAASGIRGKTLIINLPGSPKAVGETLPVVLPVLNHAVRLLRGTSQEREHHNPK